MGWYYDFYKLYRTTKEDCLAWADKNSEDLPSHLHFFSIDSGYDFTDIERRIMPIRMYEDGKQLSGVLVRMYPVALWGRTVWEVQYKSPKDGWYRFVKLSNKRAKVMVKFGCNAFLHINDDYDKDEYIKGKLGKMNNQFKTYHGKLRNVVYVMHQ